MNSVFSGQLVFFVEMHGSDPANDNTDGQHKEDHQGPGHGYLPEQKPDVYDSGILNNKDHNQK
jgi:hypothetical protein